MSDLWSIKYFPRKVEDVAQKSGVVKLKGFIENFSKEKKNALLIYGSVGSGKTSSVHVVANELNLELIEVNASDHRNSAEINEKIGNALFQRSLFSSGKIVLIDEVDGIAGNEDRGGVSALVSLIEKSPFPVVLTANDPWDHKLSSLRSKCQLLEFSALNYLSVFSVLKNICEKEGVNFDDVGLKTLARSCGGDLRAAINDLQNISRTSNIIDAKSVELLDQRDKEESMFSALTKIFKSSDANVAVSAFENVNEDLDKCLLWIDENLPKEYKNPKDICSAYNCLSRANIFFSRIRRQQYWRLLYYAGALMTSGVAVSKEARYLHYVKYSPTQRILKIWRSNMKLANKKSIVEKLALETHSSKKKVNEHTISFFKNMFESKSNNKEIISSLDLSDDEVEWLSSKD